jgi:sarcosine oxidase, subunit beta
MVAVDVVILGGGCVGASAAFHLAEAGHSRVLLLEANTLASGSTSKAAGGIRLQHGDPLNAMLAHRSLAEFTRFEQLTGVDIGFHQVGYLFLIDSPGDLAIFQAAAAMQQSLGFPVELLTAEAAQQLVPQLVVEDLLGATYCALDGYATPESVVHGYAAAARRRGVEIRQGARATRILTERGRVRGVEVAGEVISTGTVICAAGTGSRSIAATAGVDLPVHPEPRRIFYSSQNGGIPDDIPLTLDFGRGFYFHRVGPGLVFAGREFEAEDLMEPALHRLPALADVPISSHWHGDYDMSPDHNGMIGQSPAVQGLYYATGFSGHGFQLSPAVGEHLAELITGRAPTIDLSPLTAERFDGEQTLRVEPIVV